MSQEKKKILVVAAHPDDETLGCGGTLLRHAHLGHETAVLCMTDGTSSRDGSRPGDEAAKERQVAMAAAMARLKVGRWHCEKFPDNALDTVPLLQVCKAVETFCSSWGMPELVYTHFHGDLNIDHCIVHRAVMTSFRPQPGSTVKEILTFEVPSSTGWSGAGSGQTFAPTCFVDIEPFLQTKLEALEDYRTEMRPAPHARSLGAVEHLARTRGNTVGMVAAEAFGIERRLLGGESDV